MKHHHRCNAKLRLYPDPILKAVCEPVGDDEDVSGVIRDMMHILTNSKTGVGLAAPQAGHSEITVTWTSERGATFIDALYANFTARIIQHEIDHLDGKCKIGERHE